MECIDKMEGINITQSSDENNSPRMGSFIIDTPRDEGLKSRELLWNFQQKNRGTDFITGKKQPNLTTAQNTSKILNDKNNSKCTTKPVGIASAPKCRKSRTFPKFRTKSTSEVYNSSKLSNSLSNVFSDSEATKESKLLYSNALTIGKTLYNHMKDEYKEEMKALQTGIDASNQQLKQAIEKFPELASTLTKLGYLKMTKNVVHFGGGFFGRQPEKMYNTDKLSRSATCVENEPFNATKFRHSRFGIDYNSNEAIYERENEIKRLANKLEYLESLPLLQMELRQSSASLESSKQDDNASEMSSWSRSSSLRSDDKKSLFLIEHARRKEARNRRLKLLEDQQKNALPPSPIITKQSLVNRYTKENPNRTKHVTFKEEIQTGFDLINNKMKKARIEQQTQTETIEECHKKEYVEDIDQNNFSGIQSPVGRNALNVSDEIPEHKVGPVAHAFQTEEDQLRTLRPAWENKSATDNDAWVQQIQKSNLVDHNSYNTYARTKFPKIHQRHHTTL